MIKGHEAETFELTKSELVLAQRMVKFLEKKTKKNPIKANEIILGLKNNWGIDLKPVRLRKIINYYRVNSVLPIMSSSKGYYVSYDKKEIEKMIDSLGQRATSIMSAGLGLQRIIMRDLKNK